MHLSSKPDTALLTVVLVPFRTLTCNLLGPVSRLFRLASTALRHNFFSRSERPLGRERSEFIILSRAYHARIASELRFCFGHKSFYLFGIPSCLATSHKQMLKTPFNMTSSCILGFQATRVETWAHFIHPLFSTVFFFPCKSLNSSEANNRELQTQWLNATLFSLEEVGMQVQFPACQLPFFFVFHLFFYPLAFYFLVSLLALLASRNFCENVFLVVFNIFQSKTIWRIRRMYIISDQIMSENSTRF